MVSKALYEILLPSADNGGGDGSKGGGGRRTP